MNTRIDPDQTISKLQKSILANPIEVDLTDRIMKNLDHNDKQVKRIPTKFRETWTFKTLVTLAASVAAVSILIGAGMASPAVAATLNKIPLVNSLFHFADDSGLNVADRDGLYNALNVSDTHDGLTVKASAVSYDGTRVSVAIESNESKAGRNLASEVQNVTVKVDGKDIESYASAANNNVGMFFFPTSNPDSLILEFGDLKNQGGVSFPNHFNATVDLSVKGIQQSFKLDVPVQLNTSDTVVLEPAMRKDYNGIAFKVNKIEMTPITTNITTEVTIPSDATNVKKNFGYELVDDPGKKVGVIYANGWNADNGNTFITDTKFEPFTKVPKSITIKPFTYLYQDHTNKYLLDADGNIKVNYIPQLETTIHVK
ncbi:DUF4179 domain-containing protein [Paenibacillus campi]|uniref:DUF4179 domain-containing protein n=1 Tax=Paenibacillus campi TaxID=3106031 RepID=UPI002AFF7149|nr:DUF4179 domain-containing protein [Paenibacillus sp. SGZ-1014]